MKKQVARFSPHQNGKVFAVLMALSSCLFIIPMTILMALMPPPANGVKPPVIVFLLFPLLYLVFGYLSVAVGCWFYNFMFRYIGGVEFETTSAEKGV